MRTIDDQIADLEAALAERAESRAETITERYDRGLSTDAHLVALWLRDADIHPQVLANQIDSWTDIDWRDIEDETGIPCGTTVRNLVAEKLREGK